MKRKFHVKFHLEHSYCRRVHAASLKDLKESANLIEDELQEFGDLQGMDCGIARLARLRGCRKVSR